MTTDSSKPASPQGGAVLSPEERATVESVRRRFASLLDSLPPVGRAAYVATLDPGNLTHAAPLLLAIIDRLTSPAQPTEEPRP